MPIRKKSQDSYHHGDLAESFLDAVEEISEKFGLEAVTLRACAKLVGVAPSAAFRHFADKRALLTAFGTRALNHLSDDMKKASNAAERENAFAEVGLSYVNFALTRPAFFQAMWRTDLIYGSDEAYQMAVNGLGTHLKGGFANTLTDENHEAFSPKELLAWSSVHGLAGLFVSGALMSEASYENKLSKAREMISTMAPALRG